MTTLEILKQADQIVTGLIQQKTPPVFETCRKAYSDLGDLVAYAHKSLDESVPSVFAAGVDSVIQRLEAFRASHGIETTEKQMSDQEFTVYVKEQVDAALAEPLAKGLKRLHALQSGISKALSFFGSEGGMTFPVYVDPWQQATAEREGKGPVKITSGTAQADEVTATPGISIDDLKSTEPGDILKAVAVTAEKAAPYKQDFGWGWSLDLASKEFLEGERTVDFGRDGSKT